MPLTGTRDLTTIAATAPLVAGGADEPWQLPGAQILQLMYEIDDSAMTSLLPNALHPTIPPTLVFTVTRFPDSPAGPFVLAEVRVGCRSGARPRGFLARGYCDSVEAAKQLGARWGYPLEVADVTLEKRYDKVQAGVRRGAATLLDMQLSNPEPVSGNDVQYLASLNLARMNRDGAEAARLVQVDPEYTFRSADRGKPMLSAFEPAAWLLDGARTVWPVSASYCTADVAMPVIRYLVDPVKAPLVSVERV